MESEKKGIPPNNENSTCLRGLVALSLCLHVAAMVMIGYGALTVVDLKAECESRYKQMTQLYEQLVSIDEFKIGY